MCIRDRVYTNADTPRDAAQGRAFGAQGIGLCRTEHMFFEGERIKAMREMIVADNTTDRKKALDKILPYQQGDFEGIYEAMEGCPVAVSYTHLKDEVGSSNLPSSSIKTLTSFDVSVFIAVETT